MRHTHTVGDETTTRYADLKQMLDGRRRVLQAEVQGKMRGVREEGTWGGKLNEVLDAVESSEADIQEDIEFALIQMKSETLKGTITGAPIGGWGHCDMPGLAKGWCVGTVSKSMSRSPGKPAMQHASPALPWRTRPPASLPPVVTVPSMKWSTP